MAQRPIVPASSSTAVPSTRRTVIAPPSQAASSGPSIIVPRQATTTVFTSRRVVPRVVPLRDFVLEEDKFLSPPSPRRVTLAELIGTELDAAARELRDDPFRRRVFEEVIRADACYADGKYRRPRRQITVEYVKMKKPIPIEFLEDKISVSLPIIRYPNGPCFGSDPFLEFTDDTYATEHKLRGKWIPIYQKGMHLQMVLERRTCSHDRWVYRPCADDGEIIQDMDVIGKITNKDSLRSKDHVDQVPVLCDVNGLAISLNDIRRFVWVIEIFCHDGLRNDLLVVLDRAREVRYITNHVPKFSDSDPE